MTTIVALFVMSFLFFAAASSAVVGQNSNRICGMRSPIIKQLAEKWRERPIWTGVNNLGNKVELWQAPNGSFTILTTEGLSGPDDWSCMVGRGTGGELVFHPKDGV